jgi:hypothetical protein
MMGRMRKRSRKREDVNETAFNVVAAAISEEQEQPVDAVRAAAAALGRLGGLKGGPARAKSMSPAKRKASAKKAAAARWAAKK